MKLQFSPLNEQGKRENNEDNYYPRPEDEKPVKDLYMVCDGVGGAEKGEVASKIACSAIGEYFKRNKTDEVNDSFVQSAIMQAELGMRKYLEHNPESRGMATTLTLLYFDKNQAVVAHCGDSRVYQVRDGAILHKTFDHSLVNELLASGAIKDEEAARNHPKKNVITRALSGGKEHTEADVTFITDVKKDDFFLLCSDGILESVDDAKIKQLFVKENTAEFIRDEIKNLCDGYSNDNFTAIVVKTEQGIVATKTPIVDAPTPEIVTTEQETPPVQTAEEETAEELIIIKEEVQENYEKKSNKPIKYLILIGVLVILAFAGYKYGLPLLKSDKKEKTEINILEKRSEPAKEVEAEQKQKDAEDVIGTKNNQISTGVTNKMEKKDTTRVKIKQNSSQTNSTNLSNTNIKTNLEKENKLKKLEKEIKELQSKIISEKSDSIKSILIKQITEKETELKNLK